MLSEWIGCKSGWGIPDYPALHFRALHGTVAPFTGLEGRVSLFLSSTWGRADQQTSRDSNRVWGVLFCAHIHSFIGASIAAGTTNFGLNRVRGLVSIACAQ